MRPSLVQVRAQPKLLHRLCIRQSLQRLLGNASKAFQAPEIQLHTISGTSLRRAANRNTRKFCSDCTVEQNTLTGVAATQFRAQVTASDVGGGHADWPTAPSGQSPTEKPPASQLFDTCGAYILSALPIRQIAFNTKCPSSMGPKQRPTSRASEEFVTQKSIASLALKQVQERWLQIIQRLHDCSILAQTTAQTAHEQDLIVAALKGYQASSLQTYLRHIENFLSYLDKSQISLHELTLPQFLDYLWACQDSQHEDRHASRCKPANALKALSWFHKKAQIDSLRLVCLNPLALAFSKPDGPMDRNEAIPLPLAIVVAWEDKIREPNCPPALALLQPQHRKRLPSWFLLGYENKPHRPTIRCDTFWPFRERHSLSLDHNLALTCAG